MPEAQPGLSARAPPERAQRSGLTPGLRSWRPRVAHRAQRQNGLAVPAGARAFAVSWRLGRPPRRASPLPEGGKRGPLGVPRRAQPPPAAHPEKRRARGRLPSQPAGRWASEDAGTGGAGSQAGAGPAAAEPPLEEPALCDTVGFGLLYFFFCSLHF